MIDLLITQPEGFDILVWLSGFSHGTDVWLGNAQDLIASKTASVMEILKNLGALGDMPETSQYSLL